jgi:hypothetical protein
MASDTKRVTRQIREARTPEGPTSVLDQIAIAGSSNATRHPPIRQLLDGQLVVAAPNVLHERMPGDDDPGVAVLLGPSRRS